MVEDCGAAGECEFRQPSERAGAGGFLVRARPDAILSLEPREKIVVLSGGQIPREGLIEMVMRVDEPRQDDLAGEVNYRVGSGREFLSGAYLFDKAVLRVDPGILQFAALTVHGDQDLRVFCQQRVHAIGIQEEKP